MKAQFVFTSTEVLGVTSACITVFLQEGLITPLGIGVNLPVSSLKGFRGFFSFSFSSSLAAIVNAMKVELLSLA